LAAVAIGGLWWRRLGGGLAHRNGLGTAMQLAPIGIKHMIRKEKLHVGCPKPATNALKE